MKRALLFPGQGSQTVGMGKDLASAFASARNVFEEVDEALGQHLSRIMFDGPEETLTLTENAQPAIMASSMALLRVLEQETGFRVNEYAAYLAGHSLGEYTALCAGGSFSLSDTAKLLKLRGQAMQKAVPPGEGLMAAILGLEFAQVEELVAKAASAGVCAIANDNSPGQVVISGAAAAVELAMTIAKEMGAKRALPLAVSAPFHSPLMEPAAGVMRAALAQTAIRVPSVPLIANVTARPVHDVDAIRDLLVRQVCGMVRWRESVETLATQGVTSALEIGVGKVLTGLVKRISRDMNATCIASAQDVEGFVAAA